MVLMSLGLLTSTFAYIPKATLAGVIISAVIFMVEYEMVPLLWRTKSMCACVRSNTNDPDLVKII
jgi:sodium-independent sulfate anion transporter 11